MNLPIIDSLLGMVRRLEFQAMAVPCEPSKEDLEQARRLVDEVKR